MLPKSHLKMAALSLVKIFDAAGQLVSQQNERGHAELALQGLTEGVYFLEVVSEGENLPGEVSEIIKLLER